jgi:hypothetical protein
MQGKTRKGKGRTDNGTTNSFKMMANIGVVDAGMVGER